MHTRALVVDDDATMRKLICTCLELGDTDVEVAAEAADGDEAIQRWHETRPDVVVLDHRMPGRDGLHVAEELLAEDPTLAVILWSASLDDALVRAARRLGVAACLSKEHVVELPDVIRDLAGGTA